MRLISGGVELKEKWQRTISSFTQNFDQDDPEFISLREAFMERFKEHGFVIDTIAKFNEETQALDEIIGRLQDLQKRNNVLLKKYKGDEKFARVHKRIREVNKQREDKGQKPMFSFLDEEIAAILNIIKEDVDAKVYDRNDILKKDAYFRTYGNGSYQWMSVPFSTNKARNGGLQIYSDTHFTTVYQPI